MTTTDAPALLLIAHGTRDPRGAEEMDVLLDLLRARLAAPAAAWLEDFADPDVTTAACGPRRAGRAAHRHPAVPRPRRGACEDRCSRGARGAARRPAHRSRSRTGGPSDCSGRCSTSQPSRVPGPHRRRAARRSERHRAPARHRCGLERPGRERRPREGCPLPRRGHRPPLGRRRLRRVSPGRARTWRCAAPTPRARSRSCCSAGRCSPGLLEATGHGLGRRADGRDRSADPRRGAVRPGPARGHAVLERYREASTV
jgi:hypothetical protein